MNPLSQRFNPDSDSILNSTEIPEPDPMKSERDKILLQVQGTSLKQSSKDALITLLNGVASDNNIQKAFNQLMNDGVEKRLASAYVIHIKQFLPAPVETGPIGGKFASMEESRKARGELPLRETPETPYGVPTGALKRALAGYLESARLSNDPAAPSNAALVYLKLNKLLDAGDAYREALHRKPGYSSAEKGLEEIEPRLERLSAKIRDFAARLPPCKHPYERYLNPYEMLAVNGRMAEIPAGATLRKLKQRVIQQVQLNDGHADWLEGAEIGESRILQILKDLDDESGRKPLWHWIIYEYPELNRFLSHGDPLYFAFFAVPFEPPRQARSLYWQIRDKNCGEEAFFEFINSPFLANFEAILTQALDLNDPELVQALCSGRLPAVELFDYFRRANKWMDAKASEIKGYVEGLGTPEGINWWKETPKPMAWFSVPLANALPDECKAGRTELCCALGSLAFDLHKEQGLTKQALEVIASACNLRTDEGIADGFKEMKAALEQVIKERKLEEEQDKARVIKERKQQEAEEAKWNKTIKIRSDEFEINKAFVRYNEIKIPAGEISGIKFGVIREIMNGISTNSFLIDVAGKTTKLSIECKRVFRSVAQAQADFVEILEALFHQIIPTYVIGLADQITSGKTELRIGSFVLTKGGVKCDKGSLWRKEQLILPYAALTFFDDGGYLRVSTAWPEKTTFKFGFRGVWNAVILEKLVEVIKLMQDESKL